jgi:hypothetical protein
LLLAISRLALSFFLDLIGTVLLLIADISVGAHVVGWSPTASPVGGLVRPSARL